jgi:hypothetical protein
LIKKYSQELNNYSSLNYDRSQITDKITSSEPLSKSGVFSGAGKSIVEKSFQKDYESNPYFPH